MPTAANLYYFCHEAEGFSGGEGTANTPLILIHGAGGTHLHYPPELRRLNGFPVAALDLPGHGKSIGIVKQSINDYVKIIQDFMDAINLPAAVIIGHSMGSAIALQLALNAPDRVLGLVLLGSGSRLRVAPFILENTATEATFPLAVKSIVEASFSSETSPRLKELATQAMLATRPTVLHGDFTACNGFDIGENLGKIQKPTLILCGTDDKMTPPKYSKSLHEQIPISELELIEGAGHMVMLEKPRQVAEAVERFVEKL
ncbi:MAG TPA: alpha/beta hydrolase [Anaerolineales bacterium]|nr:alpha/beta hydrolase [Anaerolineales bacterium]